MLPSHPKLIWQALTLDHSQAEFRTQETLEKTGCKICRTSGGQNTRRFRKRWGSRAGKSAKSRLSCSTRGISPRLCRRILGFMTEVVMVCQWGAQVSVLSMDLLPSVTIARHKVLGVSTQNLKVTCGEQTFTAPSHNDKGRCPTVYNLKDTSVWSVTYYDI